MIKTGYKLRKEQEFRRRYYRSAFDDDNLRRAIKHGRLWVCIYETNQNYGGPEEGGWWYEVGELVKKVRIRTWRHYQLERERIGEEVMELNSDGRNRNLSSIGCVGFYERQLRIGRPEEYYPQTRPYYC